MLDHDLLLDLLAIALRHPLDAEDQKVIERALTTIDRDIRQNALGIVRSEVRKQEGK